MNDTTFSGNGKVSFIPVITNTTTQPQTNADRIRAMTDEELARFLWNCAQPCCPPINCAFEKCGAEKCWFSWLKSPVEVDE